MSRWDPSHDRDQRDVAAALARHHSPYWVVIWLSYHRSWVGFYLGPHRVGPLRHEDPDELSRQMKRNTPWNTPVRVR